MKKLLRKALLRTLTTELANVKGETGPTNHPPLVEPPPPETDARANIIELG